jgi:Flp pilus assembly pilin Flp
VPLTSGRDRPALTTRARRHRAFNRRRGQGVVEYGLILSLSAALAVILLVFFGGSLSAVLKAVGDAIDAAS